MSTDAELDRLDQALAVADEAHYEAMRSDASAEEVQDAAIASSDAYQALRGYWTAWHKRRPRA
jgi:hypothetical protein